jgi:hypothetical protein
MKSLEDFKQEARDKFFMEKGDFDYLNVGDAVALFDLAFDIGLTARDNTEIPEEIAKWELDDRITRIRRTALELTKSPHISFWPMIPGKKLIDVCLQMAVDMENKLPAAIALVRKETSI